VAALALSACGGGDDDTSSGKGASPSASEIGATAPTDSPTVPDLETGACDVLTTDQVSEAVGTPVKDGVTTSGPATTGGTFSSCQYASDDADNPADAATVSLYPNTDAADSARGEDAQPIEGLGGQAYTAAYGSIWVYVDQISVFVQWYTFDGTDQENLPKSKALAKAVIAELA
jgi:Protein of unknown function (DUF3558)